MALKLSRDQLAAREDIVSRLRTTGDDLDDAVTRFNEALDAARMAIEPYIDAYGEAVEAARVFASSIAGDVQAAIDARSERWQESAKGRAAIAFHEAWDGIDLGLEIALPDDLDELDLDAADDLADAPAAPD